MNTVSFNHIPVAGNKTEPHISHQ